MVDKPQHPGNSLLAGASAPPRQAEVTATPSFQQIILNSQIKACNEAVALCADRERLASESSSIQTLLRQAEAEFQQECVKQGQSSRSEVALARQQLADSSAKAADCRTSVENGRSRANGLAAGRFLTADSDRITLAIASAQKEHDAAIRKLSADSDACRRRLDDLRSRAANCESELTLVRRDWAAFAKGEIPPHMEPLLKQAAARSEQHHAEQLVRASAEMTRITSAIGGAQSELAALGRRLQQAQSQIMELERVSAGGVLARLTSSVWWGSLGTDYAKEVQTLGANKMACERHLAELADSLLTADQARASVLAAKAQIIADAVSAERETQKRLCQERSASLPQELEQIRVSIASAEKELSSVQSTINAASAARTVAGEKAKASEESAIRSEALQALQNAESALADAESKETMFRESLRAAEAGLADLPRQQAALREARQAASNLRLAEIAAGLETLQVALAKLVTQYGIGVSHPFARTAIEGARDARVRQLAAMRGELPREQPRVAGAFKRPAARSSPMTADAMESAGPPVSPDAVGNLYIDFARNADDNVNRQGQSFRGLRRQLFELRERHSGGVLPGIPNDADLLSLFQDAFFPNGLTQTYLICNLSVVEGQAYLALRPKTIGPRLAQLLPNGLTIALCGRLWDNQREPDNPVFLPQRIVDLSHSDARPFERELTAFVFVQSEVTYPAFRRQRNTLTSEFIAALPPISARTRDRLQDWRAYLDWKERLIQANLVGLRYLRVDLTPEGRYRFLVACESKEAFERVRKTFRNDELRAFPLGYSLDPWEFRYNEDHRGRDVELGDFVRHEELQLLPDVDAEGMPWENPFVADVYFRLDEEDQDEFDAMAEGGSHEDVVAHFRGRLQTSGFLALSVVGDLSLVRRQRRELDLLQQQSGYAPFLSSYLFDIKSANVPNGLAEITDDQWYRTDLNEDQKLAVRKMISTPDLAMVQGPPGTGKTTMIAEATWQFVRQRKKVLLVSQANMAVENALERLALAPAVRAIRLGRKGEKDQPFSLTRALETYYGSIAKTCQRRTLGMWKQSESQGEAVANWLQSSDLLAADIASLRDQDVAISTKFKAAEAELAAENARVEHARDEARMRRDAEEFVKLLDRDAPWAGQLPEGILRVFHDSIAEPMSELLIVGIRVNRVWPRFDHGQLAEKPAYAVELLREWRHLLSTLPQLLGDLERLRAAEGELVLAPADAIELGELNRRLLAAQKAMEEDASRVSEWQSIQKQIREIKRRGSGLDRALYERVFCEKVSDKPAHVRFTDPAALRLAVVAALDEANEAIQRVEAKVAEGITRTRDAAVRYLATLGIDDAPDTARIRQLQGKVREAGARASELAAQLEQKRSRLQAQMNHRAKEDNLGGEWTPDKYQQMRKVVADRQQAIEVQREQTRAFRQDWEPMLQQWVDDLSRPDTLRSDQTYFLPTYIAACNVVGVTCTENRRTLEEAGHTRFDVVIVDEVSKATPPEIIMPLMMGRTAILVGDHRQLPPLFKEREGSWEEVVAAEEETAQAGEADLNTGSELTAENFERFRTMVTASLFKEHFENAPDPLKSFLFTQYRMHPHIMRVVNQFYENRLVCGLVDPDALRAGSDPRGHRVHKMTLAGTRGQHYLKPDQHAIWIDSTLDPNRQKHFERRDGGKSKVNDLEAILIAKSLVDIEVACRAMGFGQGDKKPKQVGVITFYGRQVRNIREAVKRMQRFRRIEFTAIRYDVNTVDRYQGQERPIIIVSMVRNPPWKLSARANTAQFERINVALSRAQELLLVVGAKDVFCSYPVDLPYLDRPGRRQVEVYRYIIDEIQRGGGFWRSDQLLSTQEYAQLAPKPDTHFGRR